MVLTALALVSAHARLPDTLNTLPFLCDEIQVGVNPADQLAATWATFAGTWRAERQIW